MDKLRQESTIGHNESGGRPFQLAAIAASVVVSLANLLWMLSISRHGFDLTDESFYFLWISNPSLYEASLTQFGFIYHPLYRLAGGDLILVRQANVGIFFSLAFVLGMLLFRRISAGNVRSTVGFEPRGNSVVVALSLAFASISLLGFLPWLPTPSYNTLGGQAVLLAAIGLLLAERDLTWRSVAGWCLVGVAGWLSFMAKPTSGAALGFVVVVYALLSRKFNVRLLLLGGATALSLLVISALAIDGSLAEFVARYQKTLHLYRINVEGYGRQSMLRLGQFGLTRPDAKLLLAALVFLVSSFILLRMRNGSRIVFAASILVCGLAVAIMAGMIDFPALYESLGAKVVTHKSFGTKSIVVVLIGAVAALLLTAAMRGSKVRIVRSEFALILLFVLLPYVYVFGTALNYWFIGPMAGIFWVAASILLLASIRPVPNFYGVFVPTIVVSQLLTIAAASITVEYPYRQPQPLRLSQVVVPLGEAAAPVRLSSEFAGYISGLRRIASSSGFTAGEPLLDFTGQTPGAAVALNARAIGQPWLLGGYRWTRDFVLGSLSLVSCDDIARAWILSGPSNKRAVPLDLLSEYGIDLSRDYVAVGSVPAQDPDRYTNYEQVLYKPLRSPDAGRQACETKRGITAK